MRIIERRNGENLAKIETAGVLFDRGCFMVKKNGKEIKRSKRKINSFTDLEIFDSNLSRKGSKRHTEIWIHASSRRG